MERQRESVRNRWRGRALTPYGYLPYREPGDRSVRQAVQRQEAHHADQIEQQVVTESQSAQPVDNLANASLPAEPATSQPVTISLGQTIGQVTAILGKPSQFADLGSKKIYKYKDMKITFLNGKVSDVQ